MRHEQLFGFGEDAFLDLETDRVDIFLDQYAQAISAPIALKNHAGNVECVSSKRNRQARRANLLKYLENPNASLEQYEWGRTIYSEVLFADLIRTIYAKRFTRFGYTVMLSPYTLDTSQHNPYQKGADIVVVNTKEGDDDAIGTGVCGIDVTLGGQVYVDNKLARPGFQARTAMPVLVVPVKRILSYFGDDGTEVLTQFDTYGRQSIKDFGYPTALYGMSKAEYQRWRQGTAHTLETSIRWCKSGLEAHWDTHLSQYQYSSHVMNMIDLCSELFKL